MQQVPDRVLAIDVSDRVVRGIVLSDGPRAVAGGYAQLDYEPSTGAASVVARIATALDVKATLPVVVTGVLLPDAAEMAQIVAAISAAGFVDIATVDRSESLLRSNPSGASRLKELVDSDIASGLLTSHAGLRLDDLAAVVGAGLGKLGLGAPVTQPDDSLPTVGVSEPPVVADADADPFTSNDLSTAEAEPAAPGPEADQETSADHLSILDDVGDASGAQTTSAFERPTAGTQAERTVGAAAAVGHTDALRPRPHEAGGATLRSGQGTGKPSSSRGPESAGSKTPVLLGKTPVLLGLLGILVALALAAFFLLGGADDAAEVPAVSDASASVDDSTSGSTQSGVDVETADALQGQEVTEAQPTAEATDAIEDALARAEARAAAALEEEEAATAAEETAAALEEEAATAAEETADPAADADQAGENADAVEEADVVDPLEGLPPLSSLPERGAVFRPPTLFLEGPVRDQETADRFYEAAAAVVGPDNVVNNYVVRPDAPETVDGNVRVEQAILFDTSSATISDAFIPTLDLAVLVMGLNPQVQLIVEGHTDSVGPADGNLELSERRAQSVVDYLVGRGTDRDRLQAVGFGETVPIADNDTEEGRQINRRIEFELLDLLSAE